MTDRPGRPAGSGGAAADDAADGRGSVSGGGCVIGREALVARLEGGGFVAAGEEADELIDAAGGDAGRLEGLVARRETGEPLAWITGTTTFCGLTLRVEPGVYVPRWQTEVVAERAAARLPDHGVAVDACTGAGAIAALLRHRRPGARVLATELDPVAAACARRNGADVLEGDLLDPVPDDLAGTVDLVVGVVPYVPTPELPLLQRDTLTFETTVAYDGGSDGLDLARRLVAQAARLLRPGGALVLELGGTQDAALAPDLTAAGFTATVSIRDEDGDPRGVESTRSPT